MAEVRLGVLVLKKYDKTYHLPGLHDVDTRPAGLERVELQFDYEITSHTYAHIICKGYTRRCG